MNKITSLPKVGSLVVRGPKWIWGSQDQGSSYGIVRDNADTNGWIRVDWVVEKNGTTRVLHSNKYQWNDDSIVYYEDSYPCERSWLLEAYEAALPEWQPFILDIAKRADPLSDIVYVKKAEVVKILNEYPNMCSAWTNKIKEKFPEACNAIKEYVDFSNQPYTLTTHTDKPLFIGYGLAPSIKLRGKCLMVDSSEYELEVSESTNNGVTYKVIAIKIK